MDIKHDINSVRLTSAELGYLWATYLVESKCYQATSCLKTNMNDKDIQSAMQLAIDLADKNLHQIEDIFHTVGAPIPCAFDVKDVNKKAPKLFSDVLNLYILKIYTVLGLSNYGTALSMAARSDVKNFFTKCLTTAIELSNKIDEISIQKGIFQRTPYVTIPDQVEFAHNKDLLGHFIGHNRRLNYFEITYLFNSSMTMSIVEAILTALSQTVIDEKLHRYCIKGKKIAADHLEKLNSILIDEELTTPKSLITEITNSTHSPFSDRLSSYFAVSMLEDMLFAYSSAKLNTMRKDISATLSTLSMELTLFIKDGLEIMIDNGWYEKAPENIDRKELISH